jgi:hypothetical protein
VLDEGVRSGALRRVGRWYFRVRGVSCATHPTFFEALLPLAAPDAEARARCAREISALRTDKDVQMELLAIGGEHLGVVDPAKSAAKAGASPAPSDDALRTWAQLVELGSPGETFADATIERVGGRGEAHFRVLPKSSPVLRVIVEWERGQPSYFHAGPYSISYAAREDQSLRASEEQFLRELCRRTTEALALRAVK